MNRPRWIVRMVVAVCCLLVMAGAWSSSEIAEEQAAAAFEDGARSAHDAVDSDNGVDVETTSQDDAHGPQDAANSDEKDAAAALPEEDADNEQTPGPEEILGLIDAQRRALADNPSLEAGAERVAQAKQLVVQARSMYYPQIDLNYSYTFTWLPSSYTDPTNELLDDTENVLRDLRRQLYLFSATTRQPSIQQRRNLRAWLNSADDAVETWREYLDSPQESATLNITAGWLLFDGFAREFANAMARHGYGEARAGYREGQRILLDAIAQAYYGGQYAREQLKIAQSDISFYERLHKEALARREIGRGSTSDVLAFETALYAARANVLRSRREHEMARIAMAVLLGVPEGYLRDEVQLEALEDETPEVMTPPDADDMIALAYAYRPDLEQRELAVQRARASVRREYAKFAPQIAVVAGAQTANVNDTGIRTDRIVSTVGLNASMNLFAGGRRRAEVVSAKHAHREAELRVIEAEQKIASEVRQALSDLRIAQEALTLQRAAAECVRKSRDLVEIEYNAGKAMLVRLNQAQQEYNLAAGMLAQARVNLQRSWQALHAATGVNLTILSQGNAKTDQAAAQSMSAVSDHE